MPYHIATLENGRCDSCNVHLFSIFWIFSMVASSICGVDTDWVRSCSLKRLRQRILLNLNSPRDFTKPILYWIIDAQGSASSLTCLYCHTSLKKGFLMQVTHDMLGFEKCNVTQFGIPFWTGVNLLHKLFLILNITFAGLHKFFNLVLKFRISNLIVYELMP